MSKKLETLSSPKSREEALRPKSREQALRRRIGAAVVASALLAGGGAAANYLAGPDEAKPTVTYHAEPGDSYSVIAGQIATEPGQDILKVQADLEQQRIDAGDPNVNVVSIGEEFQIPADSPLAQQQAEDRQKTEDFLNGQQHNS